MNDYRAKEFAPADKVRPTLPDGVDPYALIRLLWACLATSDDPTPEHYLAEPIWQMIDCLTTDEKRVIDMYYGITCPRAQGEILAGWQMESMGKLYCSALAKIGHHLQAWLIQPHEQTWRFQVRCWLPESKKQKR